MQMDNNLHRLRPPPPRLILRALHPRRRRHNRKLRGQQPLSNRRNLSPSERRPNKRNSRKPKQWAVSNL